MKHRIKDIVKFGECPKHPGNSMFDCPMCAMEKGRPDYVFDILKTKDIVLPPCDSANGKSADIETLPTKYVWVTYDPLYERIICVHEKSNSECDKCRKIREARDEDNFKHGFTGYFLETLKFKLKP